MATFEPLGVHTFGLAWDGDAAAAVERLAAEGFRAFEFIAMAPHLDPRRITQAETTRLQRTLESVGGQALALDLPSNDINLASTSPDLVRFTVETYQATIRVAGAIGARWVVVLPGRRHLLLPPPDDRLLDILRPALAILREEARRAGVRLLIENHPQTLLPDAPAIARFLTTEAEGIVDALYDVANGAAIGEALPDAFSVLRPHLGMVHLSDSPAGHWRHDPIGTGAIDFPGIRQTLLDIGFRGPVVTEVIAADAVSHLARARATLARGGWPV